MSCAEINYLVLGRLLFDVENLKNNKQSLKNMYCNSVAEQAVEIENTYKKTNPKPQWVSEKEIGEVIDFLKNYDDSINNK